ncbi:MAG: thiamine phosphate synthase (plasmid) [Pantoea sp. Brub]|nr:thiamine phosphate synthase [Pantoea sp. Brub]
MNNINKNFPSVPHRLGLYPIVDSSIWLMKLLDLGVKTLQIRIKERSEKVLNQEIETAVLLSHKYDARIFINDYWQLAIKYNAYGVHLGQEDMEHADMYAILKSGMRLGLSTHNESELLTALTWNPSYIALGHIFHTKTKRMLSRPQGLEQLMYLANKIKHIPTVAIGGITLDRLEAVLKCGVGGISVINAIIGNLDWRKNTIKFLQKIQSWEEKYINNKQ